MVNFKEACKLMREGKKVTRPNWVSGSYWELGPDEMICYSNGSHAKIHLEQFNATDWEIYVELVDSIDEIYNKIKEHKKLLSEKPTHIRLNPKTIKKLVKNCELYEIPDRIFGLTIEEDASIPETESIVYVKKRTLSDKIWKQNSNPYYGNLPDMIPVKNVKEFISEIKDGIQELTDKRGKYILTESDIDIILDFINEKSGGM